MFNMAVICGGVSLFGWFSVKHLTVVCYGHSWHCSTSSLLFYHWYSRQFMNRLSGVHIKARSGRLLLPTRLHWASIFSCSKNIQTARISLLRLNVLLNRPRLRNISELSAVIGLTQYWHDIYNLQLFCFKYLAGGPFSEINSEAGEAQISTCPGENMFLRHWPHRNCAADFWF